MDPHSQHCLIHPWCHQTQRMPSGTKEFVYFRLQNKLTKTIKKGRKHAEKCLAQKLAQSFYVGLISFSFRCCRHLRFPMTSTNFTCFFWFPLHCSSLYVFRSKVPPGNFSFFPAVSSVFVFWGLPFNPPLSMTHARFHIL